MKEGLTLAVITILAASFPPVSVAAGPDLSDDPSSDAPVALSIAADVTLASKYLWHGIDYSDGHPVIQPEMAVGYDSFSATVWLNGDLQDGHVTEADLYLTYTRQVRPLSLTLGYGYFNYPHREGWNPSQEVFITAGLATPFHPSLSLHHDYQSGKGMYAELEGKEEIEHFLGSLAVGASLYYHRSYYQLTGFPAIEIQGGNSFGVGPATLALSVSYFLTWDNGDFTGGNAVGDAWVYSLNIAGNF